MTTDSVRIVTLPVLAFVALLAAPVTFADDRMTPLLLAVHDAPVLFNGSDGRRHLAYEVWITNFTSGDATVEGVEVIGDGRSFAMSGRGYMRQNCWRIGSWLGMASRSGGSNLWSRNHGLPRD